MIKFSVHPLFFLVFIFALFHHFLFEVLLLFTIVLIHELGHAYVAKSFGWRVKKIELLPFGGVAEMEEYGNRPAREEGIVILAGPLMNVIMIGFSFFCLYTGIWKQDFTYLFVEYNVLIMAFNLLPIWPLDGGKLLQLLLSYWMPFKHAIRTSLLVSVVGVCIYIFCLSVFYTYYFSLWVIAIFLCVSQYVEWKNHHYQFMRFIMERYQLQQRSAGRPFREDVLSLTVSSQHKVKDVIEKMFRSKKHYFCVLNTSGEMIDIFSEDELLDLYFTGNMAYQNIGDLV